jgi:hypothetical protein
MKRPALPEGDYNGKDHGNQEGYDECEAEWVLPHAR